MKLLQYHCTSDYYEKIEMLDITIAKINVLFISRIYHYNIILLLFLFYLFAIMKKYKQIEWKVRRKNWEVRSAASSDLSTNKKKIKKRWELRTRTGGTPQHRKGAWAERTEGAKEPSSEPARPEQARSSSHWFDFFYVIYFVRWHADFLLIIFLVLRLPWFFGLIVFWFICVSTDLIFKFRTICWICFSKDFIFGDLNFRSTYFWLLHQLVFAATDLLSYSYL